MDSILRAQLERMTDAELTALADHVQTNLGTLAIDDEDQIASAWRQITKASDINTILAERGLQIIATDQARQTVIDAARALQVDPVTFGESFDSLGVAPWVIKGEVSIVDREFINRKLNIKVQMITLIKSQPAITEADFYAALDSSLAAPDAALARFLMAEYTSNAYKMGLIPSADFSPMRDFVAATPVEVLQSF